MSQSRAGSIALITAGTAVAGILGYVVYFDYMRRNSPEFRKGLRKQQKKIKQAAEARAKEQAVKDQRALTLALVELELEVPPSTPEAMEAYFQEHVATAEALAAQGPEQYVTAATHFYRALRVYPQPVELLMIYQKVCPEPVFQLVLKLTQLSSAVTPGAAGASAPQVPASVADIDDSAPSAGTDAEKDAEEPVEVAANATEEAVAAVLAAEEAEEEEEEAEKTESEPASNNGSGASWERVSNDA